MNKVLLTGASGFIGSYLKKNLENRNYTVLPLTYTENPNTTRTWNPLKEKIRLDNPEEITAIIHLAGENPATKWNAQMKDRIYHSRITGTKLLYQTFAGCKNLQTFIGASAVGYYGDREDQWMDENSEPGSGFLANVCRDWEREQQAFSQICRTIHTRIGPVLGRDGGMIKRLVPIFKMGGGGVIGKGKQFISWIAVDDVVKALLFLLENQDTKGVYNLVAPHPVTNKEMVKTLGKVLRRPTFLPISTKAVQIAAGEMADELILASTRVSSDKLRDAGFSFSHPDLATYLKTIL
jgi:uncharacterized protein (TIGR01777 family)